MIIAFWITSGVFFAFFVMTAVGNIMIATTKRGSLIPLIGGIIGSVAILIVPMDAVYFYWWVPLVVDLGCFPLVFAFLITWLYTRMGTRWGSSARSVSSASSGDTILNSDKTRQKSRGESKRDPKKDEEDENDRGK